MLKKLLIVVIVIVAFQSLQAQQYIITTIAGTGVAGFNGDGIQATSAQLYYPRVLKLDDSGNIYICDNQNQRIRKIDHNTGIITTITGTGSTGYNGNGIPAASANLYNPSGLIFNNSHDLYLVDGWHYLIRKINHSTGIISTIAGTGTNAHTGDGGPAISASIKTVKDLAFDSSGNLYFAETDGYTVRKIDTTTGIVTTIAGTGVAGYNGDNILATTAELNRPFGVTVDIYGNIYIADGSNNRVRRIDHTTGIITTIAGTGVAGYNGDGIPAISAQLNYPTSIAFDSSGNLYIAENQNSRIRKVDTTTGIITTIAGNGVAGYNGDGILATTAEIQPVYVSVDKNGHIYICDGNNERVRELIPLILNAQFTEDTTICIGDSVHFINQTTPYISGATYQWLFPGGVPATSTLTNPNVNYNTPGIYTVTLVAMYANDTDSVTKTIHVILNPLPGVSISGNNVFCAGSSDTLTANATGNNPFSYNWSTGSNDDTTIVNTGGMYSVIITDSNGCQNADTIQLTENPLPNVSFTMSDTSGCSPLCINFQLATPDSANIYYWNFGDSTISTGTNIKHCYNFPNGGIFYPSLTAISVAGCTSQFISAIPVIVITTPIANFNTSESAPLQPNEVIQCINESSNYDSLAWNYNEAAVQIFNKDTVNFTIKDNTYLATICLTAYNTQCADSICKEFTVQGDLFLPNVITPNGDGINDYLKFKGLIGINKISIYNRWGTLLYKSNDYKNNWDARTKNGNKLSDGTYYYILITSEGKTYTKYFTILN